MTYIYIYTVYINTENYNNIKHFQTLFKHWKHKNTDTSKYINIHKENTQPQSLNVFYIPTL